MGKRSGKKRRRSKDAENPAAQTQEAKPSPKKVEQSKPSPVKVETVPAPDKEPSPVPKEAEDAELAEFVAGDSFLSSEQQSEKAAEARRAQRRKRLQQANKESEQEQPLVTKATSPSTNKSKKKSRKERRDQSADDGRRGAAVIASSSDAQNEKYAMEKKDDEEENSNDDDDDDFDMFAESISPTAIQKAAAPSNQRQRAVPDGASKDQQEFDDVDGYYKATPGEIISVDVPKTSANIQFRVMGVIGKGVFSTVLKCSTESNSSSIKLPPQVAIKFVRHNDTMARAAQNEVQFLQKLKQCPGIIPLLFPTDNAPLEFRGHVLLAFPHVQYNLRDVLKKFGKNVGLSLTAVRSYFQQLLSACAHLKQHGIVHSDLKPDNILVNHDFSVVHICDLGSAVESSAAAEMVTPYLVSRFYRAPEIILGLIPTYAIDLWSIAVTVGELFLGRLMFHGGSNNHMLKKFMEAMGPVPNRVIRQHLVQVKKHPLPEHFAQQAANFVFLEDSVDPVTQHKVRKHTLMNNMSPNLKTIIMKAKSKSDSLALVVEFENLLRKSLALDPTRRIPVKEALQHKFFTVGSK